MTGREFKEQIEDLGLTAEDFADAAEVSTPTLRKVFKDQFVRPATLGKVKSALKRIKAERAQELRALKVGA
jgi:predicted transcriptional regulator